MPRAAFSQGRPAGVDASSTNAITGKLDSNTWSFITRDIPYKNRYSILQSNQMPWRIAGFGDSLGDDVVAQWIADFGRSVGFNGGYLAVYTNSLFAPLTYTHSGFTTIPLPDTNWFALHFTMGVGGAAADVTFDSAGRFIVADTFRIAMIHSTNGGTYKLQVQTNGGAFTDATATFSALSASPTGVVINFATNQGEWKLKVVNVTGTNVCIGGGLWSSNRGGMSPSQLWSFGGTLADITNVHTNISVPVLASLGLTEFIWHALDAPTLVTNSLPIVLRTLAMAGCAATNVDGTFIGVNQVTDNSLRYDLGNLFIRDTISTNGYTFVDTESFGTTNDLVRRRWTLTNDCIHLDALAVPFLADLVWRHGGISQMQNLHVGSFNAQRTPLTVYAPQNPVSNLFEIKNYGGTNFFTVSRDGWLSVGGDRLTGTYMLDVFGNIFLGKTNASTTLSFVRLNSSASLSHSIQFDAQNANTATETYERDANRFTINTGGSQYYIIDADNNQTSNEFVVMKDAANPTNATRIFTVQENGGASIVAGQSTSNAFIGGTLFSSIALFTNLNAAPATLTNLGNYSVPAHTMTNNGDMVYASWGGRDAGSLANTNNFQIVFGSQTILDTGLQVSSNFTFKAWVELTRSGNTGQHAEAHFEWSGNTGATGLPWSSTNVNVELVQTNGIATTLALKGSAQRVGAHTNNSFRVWYDPVPK